MEIYLKNKIGNLLKKKKKMEIKKKKNWKFIKKKIVNFFYKKKIIFQFYCFITGERKKFVLVNLFRFRFFFFFFVFEHRNTLRHEYVQGAGFIIIFFNNN